MTAEEIITLAKLPSRETLLGMLAGGGIFLIITLIGGFKNV